MAKISLHIPNSDDDKHCLQACFRMVLHALTHEDIGQQAADEQTGFAAGHGTWQFRMLLAFAGRGFRSVDHERLYIEDFARDPRVAILKQFQNEEVAALYIEDTDLDAERNAFLQCTQSPRIQFVDRVPSLDDLRFYLNQGFYVMCHINSRIIAGKPGHQGHLVIVESLTDDLILLQDPGLPPRFDCLIPTSKFIHSWTSGSDSTANLVAVSP